MSKTTVSKTDGLSATVNLSPDAPDSVVCVPFVQRASKTATVVSPRGAWVFEGSEDVRHLPPGSVVQYEAITKGQLAVEGGFVELRCVVLNK